MCMCDGNTEGDNKQVAFIYNNPCFQAFIAQINLIKCTNMVRVNLSLHFWCVYLPCYHFLHYIYCLLPIEFVSIASKFMTHILCSRRV